MISTYDIEIVPSSSVMDYHNAIEEVLIADRFNRGQKTLSHDVSAMQFLYQEKVLDKTIPFCTDSDADIMLDCLRFDHGRSPLEYASSDIKYNLRADILPVMFYLEQVAQVMPEGAVVADLHPSPGQKAESLLKHKPLLLTPFTQTGFYARTLKNFYPGTLLEDADKTELRKTVIPVVRADLDAWLLSNPYGIKSLTEMFMIIDPAWKDAWIASFNKLTDDPAFYTIVDQNGDSKTFTEAERGQLRTMAATFFTDLIPALVAEDVRLLSSVTGKVDVVDGVAGIGLLAAMNATSNGYVMAQMPPPGTFAATVNGQPLNLPQFRYDWTVRFDASRLMNSRSVSSALWWGMRETDAVKSSLILLLDKSVKDAGGTFLSDGVSSSFAGASNAAYQWYLENASILKKGFLYQP